MKSMIGLIILILTNICFAADNPQIDDCLRVAESVSSDSGIEDRIRLNCLQTHKQGITLSDCKQIKQHRGRHEDTEKAVNICFEELKNRLSINDCFEVAKWTSDSDSRETSSLTCIRENTSKISSQQCFDYAQQVFSVPSNANEASTVCAENLVPHLISNSDDISVGIDQ